MFASKSLELGKDLLLKLSSGKAGRIRRNASVLAIITHYKYERWLAQSIESLLAQTRPPEAIVVVDDASPQPPIDLVRRYPSVTLLVADQNCGPYAMLQAMFERASYDVFMMQDADDWSTPDRLELLLSSAEDKCAEMAGCQISSLWVDISPEPELVVPEDVPSGFIADPTRHLIYWPTSILHRDLVKRIGGLSSGLRFSADTEFSCRAALAGRVINIRQCCYHRRVHIGALTRTKETGYASSERRALWAAVFGRFIAPKGREWLTRHP